MSRSGFAEAGVSVAPVCLSLQVAHTYPGNPRFTTQSEHDVWERLRDTLPDDATLLANLRIVDEEKDHESDLVVLVPGAGVVVLEVKGGSVWVEDSPDGDCWFVGNGRGGQRRVRPVDQAQQSKYAWREYVENDPRWGSRGRIAWAHGVVTPYADFPDDFATPDCPRWMLHDRGDQDALAERVAENARRGGRGGRPPTVEDLELVAEIVRGRGFTAHDLNADAAERQATADRLTAEQTALLQVTRLLHRLEIRGGAGSGKTVLALAQARQLSAGREGTSPQRVGLLCYSIGLAEYFSVLGLFVSEQRLAILGRASQRKVVNVAQKGGIVSVLRLL